MWKDLPGYLQHLAEQCSAAYSFQRRGLAAWCACKKTSAASNSLIININNQIEIIMFMILQLHDFHDQIIILGKLLRTFVWSCFILGYAALQNCKSWLVKVQRSSIIKETNPGHPYHPHTINQISTRLYCCYR